MGQEGRLAEPLKLTMGDTWSWTRTSGDYPSGDGWALSYFFSTPVGPIRQVDATVVGGEFSVTVLATDTADTTKWLPGIYQWKARVSKGSEAYTIANGRLKVEADPSVVGASSTHAEKCLAIIETALERCLLSGDVVEYEIDGAKFKKNKTELVSLRQTYRNEVRRERGQLGISLISVSLR